MPKIGRTKVEFDGRFEAREIVVAEERVAPWDEETLTPQAIGEATSASSCGAARLTDNGCKAGLVEEVVRRPLREENNQEGRG